MNRVEAISRFLEFFSGLAKVFKRTIAAEAPNAARISEQEYFFPQERFSGEIVVCDERIPINFTVSADLGGRLEIVVDAIPVTKASRKIITSQAKPGRLVEYFCIVGESSKGKKLSSDRVHLSRFSHNESILEIEVEADEATIIFDSNKILAHTTLIFYMLGFESFGPVHAESPIGRFAAYGETIAKNKDHIGGHIAVQATERTADSRWMAEAEDWLQHVRLAIAFARGARLEVPIVRYESGDQITLRFYRTNHGYSPELSVFSHLNLQPIFESAVQSYTATCRTKNALQTAVGWLLIPTTFDAVRFLAGMTSLEVLTGFILTNSEKTLINNAIFEIFSQKMRKMINDENNLDESVKAALSEKLGELKRRSFREKIVRTLEKLEISRTDLDDNVIGSLVSTRNKIVHQGYDAETNDLWEKNLVLRELLVRIVLTFFQFEGPYECYVGGRHVRHFPSCERAE